MGLGCSVRKEVLRNEMFMLKSINGLDEETQFDAYPLLRVSVCVCVLYKTHLFVPGLNNKKECRTVS